VNPMECSKVQEWILESLDERDGARESAVEKHLAGCEDCRRFLAAQADLDSLLGEAFPPAQLSDGFRLELRKRLRAQPAARWPEVLPDLAHLAGCTIGVALWSFLAPWSPGTNLLSGAAFTVVTFFAQAVLRSSLEQADQ